MSDLLLEIGLEEVPAKFMPPALAELKLKETDQFGNTQFSGRFILDFADALETFLTVFSSVKDAFFLSYLQQVFGCKGKMQFLLKGFDIPGMVQKEKTG